MAYSSWSVSFGEQPSTAKWNILGTNDASFNNGTGIANMALSTTSISNPYKFHVYRNAAANTGNGAFAKITYDTETFDTNNNFASGTYTAPVAGFYQFNVGCGVTNPATDIAVGLYKNGAEHKRIAEITVSLANWSISGGVLLQLSASDTIDIYSYASTTKALLVGDARYNWFSGFLVSQT